jgi:hypothetical protein
MKIESILIEGEHLPGYRSLNSAGQISNFSRINVFIGQTTPVKADF